MNSNQARVSNSRGKSTDISDQTLEVNGHRRDTIFPKTSKLFNIFSLLLFTYWKRLLKRFIIVIIFYYRKLIKANELWHSFSFFPSLCGNMDGPRPNYWTRTAGRALTATARERALTRGRTTRVLAPAQEGHSCDDVGSSWEEGGGRS